MILNSVLEINQIFLPMFSFPGMTALDATAGNGYDTLQLSRLSGENGCVVAMDVQEAALANTKKRLDEKAEFDNVQLVLDSHVHAVSYLCGKDLQLAVFNLGYLPGGNKNITTNADDVISSLNSLLPVLLPGGAVFVTVYPGHLPGRKEADLLETYFSQLPQNEFSVMKSLFVNQRNVPPQFFVVSKR